MRRVLCLIPLLVAVAVGVAAPQGVEAQTPTPMTIAGELILRPGDVLQITVWPDQALGGEFPVEDSGLVFLPYLQAVQAAGVSLDELRSRLRAGYAEVMRNPVVSITPVFRVTVLGEVQRPGVYAVTPTNTLFDVLGMAGGFRPEADQERLRVVRPGEVIEYDALRALEVGENMDAITLRSGDQVVVPQLSPGFNWRGILTVAQTVSIIVLTWERLSR